MYRNTALIWLLGSALLGALLPAAKASDLSTRRKLARDAQAALAARRYQSPSSALAVSPEFAIRYRGLLPVRRLEIDTTPEATPDWAFSSFQLASDLGPLRAPGVLELRLRDLEFPPGPYRHPFEVFEVYQELRHGAGWIQTLPTRRDRETQRLHVHRDQWGTGRFALAWRLSQPPVLWEAFSDPLSSGPEVIYLHGVDGTRSDYWGPRDVMPTFSQVARKIWYFQYPSGAPIADNAKAFVAAARRQLGKKSPGRRRVLFGYSMGGLVARYALEHLRIDLEIDELVLLASPSGGAEWAGVAGQLPFLSGIREAVLRAWPGIGDMIPGSEFLARINSDHAAPVRRRTLALAGVVDTNGDLVVDADSVMLPIHRRPKDYRFKSRRDFMNLNRLSHWGVHQEFAVNGFGTDTFSWLGLASPNGTHGWRRVRRRWTPR